MRYLVRRMKFVLLRCRRKAGGKSRRTGAKLHRPTSVFRRVAPADKGQQLRPHGEHGFTQEFVPVSVPLLLCASLESARCEPVVWSPANTP